MGTSCRNAVSKRRVGTPCGNAVWVHRMQTGGPPGQQRVAFALVQLCLSNATPATTPQLHVKLLLKRSVRMAPYGVPDSL